MRTPLAAAALLTSTFGFAHMASAQETQSSRMAERYVDTRNGLSIDDAIRQALEREPAVRSARSDVDASHGRRLQARLRPNPVISFEQRQEPTGTDNQTMAQVQWPLDLFRRPSRVAVADHAIEVSERALENRVRLLIADVRSRYGDAAAAVRDVRLADDAVELISRQFDLLRQRAREGAVPTLERDQLEVDLRRYEAERLIVVGRAEVAMIALKKAVGIAIDTPVQLRDRLENLMPARAAGEAATASSRDADVNARRADVRMADAEVRLAEARVSDTSARARPDITLYGGYMRMDSRFPQLGFSEIGHLEPVRAVFHYVSAGAMVTLPFRNRNQGDAAAARAEQAGAEARRDAMQLAAQAELAAAEARDTAARRALAVTESVVELAARNLDVVRQAYELGRRTAADVVVEQRRYLDVERANTETMKAAYEAHVAVRLARGDR